MPHATPIPGLSDPVFDSQAIFRAVLDAMARPGRIVAMPRGIDAPDGLAPAAAQTCLCLLDQTMSVWLDDVVRTPAAETYLRFHTGCDIAEDPAQANFALLSGNGRIADIGLFNPGTPEYPDRSTTVILQIDGLIEGSGTRLTGPGIESERRLDVREAPAGLWRTVAANNSLFPLGIDFLFVSGNRMAGLPRSVQVEV